MTARIQVAGLTGQWQTKWKSTLPMAFLGWSIPGFALVGILVVAAATETIGDVYSSVEVTNGGQVAVGFGLIGTAVVITLGLMFFLAWRHETRHQAQAVIDTLNPMPEPNGNPGAISRFLASGSQP